MKKKQMLAVLLAASMMLSAAPAVYADPSATQESGGETGNDQSKGDTTPSEGENAAETKVTTANDLATALESANEGDSVTVTAVIDSLSQPVTVKNGVTLNAGAYLGKGTVKVEAGGTLQVVDNGTTKEMVGANSINLTSGYADVLFGTYSYSAENPATNTYDTKITLEGDATAAEGAGCRSKDALCVDKGTLTVSSAFNVKGAMTIGKHGKVIVKNGGELNLCDADLADKDAPHHKQGTLLLLDMDGWVRVEKGGQLHVNHFGAASTVQVDAGGKVLVKDAENCDEEMIGSNSLNITKGHITVDFFPDGHTWFLIPLYDEAEIAGPYMDNDAWCLPEADYMTVFGKLTVRKASDAVTGGGMEVKGSLYVGGLVSVDSGKLDITDTGRLSVQDDASFGVKNGAVLDVSEGKVSQESKVYKEDGATVTTSDGQSLNIVEHAVSHTYTFDPAGGTFLDGTTDAKTVTAYDNPATHAPEDPKKEGYTFAGWEGLSADKAYSEDTTFTAKWTAESSGGSSGGAVTPAPKENTVTVPAKTDNGAVSLSATTAKKGDSVTITTKPAKGYIVKSVSVKDKDGKTVAVTGKNGEYTFTMPEGTVDVEPTFMDVSDKFADVKTTSFAHDPVAWAVNNGITVGTSDNSFSPDASCTRAQMITFLWRAAGSPKAKSTSIPFSDVKGNATYADAVQWAVENGITTGTSSTTFSPDETCTRAQIAVFLYHANGDPKASDNTSFNDVQAGKWYADAVAWMAENKITTGTTETTYSPDESCTRGQAVTFLYNNAQE